MGGPEQESSEAGATTPKALESEFGTPAIEKEQADLAKSPAQRLLAESASSAGTATPPLAAEAALLGTAAAGAAAVGKVENEVEEPATVPVDEAVKQDVQAGAGVPTQATEAEKGNEEVTAVPLGESTAEVSLPLISSVPSSSADLNLTSVPLAEGGRPP